MSMSPLPFATIAIPCLDEHGFIERCVRDALSQAYPADRVEVLVADGGSTDGTRVILDQLAQSEPRFRWIDNPGRIQAQGMNEMIRVARGDVLVRFDAHCEYAHDYLARCVEVLQETCADNVGGAQRSKAATAFQKSLCAALSSALGVGGAAYRSEEREGFVDTVFCGAFRRSVFERFGLYDPGAVTNEDAELNQRIVAGGGKLYLSRKIVVHYYPRRNFRELAHQYFRYGQGRARTLLKHRRLITLRPFVPFITVLGGTVLLVLRPTSFLTWVAFGAYATIAGAETCRVTSKHPGSRIATTWAIFPVMHVSHAVGVAIGFCRYAAHPNWSSVEKLTPRTSKLHPEGSDTP